FAVRHSGEPVEIVSWRGDFRAHRPRPALPGRAAPAMPGTRRVRKAHFGREAAEVEVARVEDLATGETVSGPAIIEETTTTIVLPPGARATIRPSHYLIDVGAHHGV